MCLQDQWVLFLGTVPKLHGKDAVWFLQGEQLLSNLHQWRKEVSCQEMLNLTWLAHPWMQQHSHLHCRPACSGVLGLLENSCHLLPVTHCYVTFPLTFHFVIHMAGMLWFSSYENFSNTWETSKVEGITQVVFCRAKQARLIKSWITEVECLDALFIS